MVAVGARIERFALRVYGAPWRQEFPATLSLEKRRQDSVRVPANRTLSAGKWGHMDLISANETK